MIVAGIMSGTSADGIDVAFCRIRMGREDTPKLQLLHHAAIPYSPAVRRAVLAAMDSPSIAVAELSRLHWRLGALYADAVEQAATAANLKPDLIGCHGQTLYHQGIAQKYLGVPTRATWQIGEASLLAERLRVPVVSDLRPADLAAGGQGAPLVPMLDYILFRNVRRNRVLVNLGGIANVTAIPCSGTPDSILAFDTGPANMVVDALMATLHKKKYDRNGETARRGRPLQQVLDTLLCDPYFAAPPPKSCGREQFGFAFTSRLLELCRAQGAADADIVATATVLSARSLLDAYARFVLPRFRQSALHAPTECLVSGGGVHNATLMGHLRDGLAALGVPLRSTAELGHPTQAKEAAAFALLAWLTWNRRPGNLPAATGASRSAILGKLTLP
jgi:anhydro-N-acetylmuramic acid kinase